MWFFALKNRNWSLELDDLCLKYKIWTKEQLLLWCTFMNTLSHIDIPGKNTTRSLAKTAVISHTVKIRDKKIWINRLSFSHCRVSRMVDHSSALIHTRILVRAYTQVDVPRLRICSKVHIHIHSHLHSQNTRFWN